MDKKNRSRWKRTLLILAVGTLPIFVFMFMGTRARGLIDVKFTPNFLVSAAELIVVGVLNGDKDGDVWKFEDTKALKGEASEAVGLTINLKPCDPAHLADVRDLLVSNGKSPVILFSVTVGDKKKSFLHIGGEWLAVNSKDKGLWNVEKLVPDLGATFAGGTDMLIRMTNHLLAHDDFEVPLSVDAKWNVKVKLGSVDGVVAGMAVVELKGEKSACLFVASAGGDKFFRPKKGDEAFDDVTAEVKLDTKSQKFVWLDMNRDGLADLVTWDGSAISVHEQTTNGTIGAADPATLFYVNGECLGLAACNLSSDGSPGILVSSLSIPCILGWEGGKWKKTDLPAGNIMKNVEGSGSCCIAADLDNDGYADVLQLRDSYGVLWKGNAGGFALPVKSAVTSGGEQVRVALGDFDANGFLDIYVSNQQNSELWENNGKGEFNIVKKHAGSLRSKAQGGASDCITMDLNHDGMSDICLLYANAATVFSYHFNRGFRCMGEEGGLDLGEVTQPSGHEKVGLQTGTVADFNDDGAQDLAVALANGDIYCCYIDESQMPGLRVRLQKGVTGPVTASVWQDENTPAPFCFGTLVVSGHIPGTYFAVPTSGEYTIKWSGLGKTNCSVRVTVEPGTTDVVLGEK